MVHHESPARSDAHQLAHDEHAHPTPQTYIRIAVVLTLITIIEVVLLYLPEWGLHVPANLMVVLFVAFSAAKFLIVVGWYMHLKFDPPFFRRMFGFALIVALSIATAFIALFHGMYPI